MAGLCYFRILEVKAVRVNTSGFNQDPKWQQLLAKNNDAGNLNLEVDGMVVKDTKYSPWIDENGHVMLPENTLRDIFRCAVEIYDENHIFEKEGQEISYKPFILTDVPHVKRVKGYPIDSLSLDMETGQYMYDMVMDVSDATEAPRGFYDFFREALETIQTGK